MSSRSPSPSVCRLIPKVAGWRDRMKGFWSDLNWMFHGSKQDHPGDLKDLWMLSLRPLGFYLARLAFNGICGLSFPPPTVGTGC